MISINKYVYKSLSNVCQNVNNGYPSSFEKFPIIAYMEEENKTYIKADNEEKKAYIRIKIDIWNNKSTTDITCKVDDEISKLGLKRIQCLDVPDSSGLKHKVLRYECIIDKQNNVYN